MPQTTRCICTLAELAKEALAIQGESDVHDLACDFRKAVIDLGKHIARYMIPSHPIYRLWAHRLYSLDNNGEFVVDCDKYVALVRECEKLANPSLLAGFVSAEKLARFDNKQCILQLRYRASFCTIRSNWDTLETLVEDAIDLWKAKDVRAEFRVVFDGSLPQESVYFDVINGHVHASEYGGNQLG